MRLRLQYFTFYYAWYELTFHFYLDFLGVRRPEIEIVHDDNWSEHNVLHQAGVEWSGSAGTGGTIQRQLASKLVASLTRKLKPVVDRRELILKLLGFAYCRGASTREGPRHRRYPAVPGAVVSPASNRLRTASSIAAWKEISSRLATISGKILQQDAQFFGSCTFLDEVLHFGSNGICFVICFCTHPELDRTFQTMPPACRVGSGSLHFHECSLVHLGKRTSLQQSVLCNSLGVFSQPLVQ